MTRPPARSACAISSSLAAADEVGIASANMADKPEKSATALATPLNSLSMLHSIENAVLDSAMHRSTTPATCAPRHCEQAVVVRVQRDLRRPGFIPANPTQVVADHSGVMRVSGAVAGALTAG